MEFRRRDVFLKIEPLLSYSPLVGIVCARRYGRDCMFNVGQEYRRVQAGEAWLPEAQFGGCLWLRVVALVAAITGIGAEFRCFETRLSFGCPIRVFAAISSQAAIVYKNFSQPVNFTYFVPCANAGQGEMVTFSGTIQTTLAETFENGWIIAQFHIQPTMTGFGQTTGITYQVVGSQVFTAKLSPTKVAVGIDAMNLSAVGGGITYHIHENYKYTFENGDFTSFAFDNFFVFCQ